MISVGRAIWHEGKGCLQFPGGRVVQLTVNEEDLLEALLASPVTVSFEALEEVAGVTRNRLHHLMADLRRKVGAKALVSHRGLRLSARAIGGWEMTTERRVCHCPADWWQNNPETRIDHQPPEGIRELRDTLEVARTRAKALGYPMPEETCR